MGDRTNFSSSAFSPAAARQTSVALLRNEATGDHRLVTSVSTRKSTEVLRINLRTGRLELENDSVAESSYETESEALEQLKGSGYAVEARGYALLGYAAAGPAAGLLLATRVREKAVLPGGHTLYAVTDSQWAMVPLQNEAADAATAAQLAGLPPPRAGDADFWRALQQFTLNNAHYYCETADVSRPFPSEMDPREPSPEFVWNSWLRQPLVELGLYDHCPALLQGAVECSTLQHPSSGGRFSLCLISRRSRRHPGTRYIARGLNSLAGPGNEIECELLTWTHPEQQRYGAGSFTAGSGGPQAGQRVGVGGGEALKWARVVWRRGTVPIWWGVQLQSLAQGLQAEVYVREEQPYEGTASYFRNVQRQHAPRPALGPPPPDAGSLPPPAGSSEGWTMVEEGSGGSAPPSAGTAGMSSSGGEQQQAAQPPPQQQQERAAGDPADAFVPITCINLLHANPKKASELMLSSHFQDAMRHVRRRLGGRAPIQVVNFDWHGNVGRLSEEKAVEGFWSLMEPFVKQTGFAAGWMEAAASPPPPPSLGPAAPPAEGDPPGDAAVAGAAAAAPATAWPPGWRMRWASQQAGLLRFNCADSLDRTNAATCFAMLPVLQEQLRVLGVLLECAVPPATAALLRSRQRSSAGDVTALAQGQPRAGAAAAPDAPEPPAELPEGWEVRQHEGRRLYIDHVNRTTQWTPPPPPSPGPGPSQASGRPAAAAAAPLSARVMQSASDMLARLQRQTAGPVSAAPRAAPPPGLERRSSPPRSAGADAGGGGHYWPRTAPSGSPNGSVPHAASAPDVSLTAMRAAGGAATAPEAPERDPARPWAFFDYDMNDVRERLLRDAVSDYVDMFRVHGDIHSFLYTGSPAMHSHVLNLVVQGGKGYGATSGVGKLQNLRVAVQRRWNNTVSDTSRQQAMELFLGLRIHDRGDQKGYFPGLQVAYRDSSQLQLGGVEAFERAPLPPAHAHHLRTPSASAAPGPLAAGQPALEAAEQRSREAEQQEEVGSDEGEERAHPVPGVPAVEHDGVLGVHQSLLDLEPLPDPLPNQLLQLGDEPAAPRLGDDAGGGEGQPPLLRLSSDGDAAGQQAAGLDPLGALFQLDASAPAARRQQLQGAADGAAGGAAPMAAAGPVPAARAMQDLLL